MSKYNSKKTMVNGLPFDSKREAERYKVLKAKEDAGEIENLRCQVPYILFESAKDADGKTIRGIRYIADFVYNEDGEEIVEDCKGYKTDVYKMKKKLMLFVRGITVRES